MMFGSELDLVILIIVIVITGVGFGLWKLRKFDDWFCEDT